MSTNHTPGPWQAMESTTNKDFWAVSAISKDGKWLHDIVYVTLDHNIEANARLIAAAPELLEIVKDLANRDVFYLGPALADKVRAAIAKATGA